jgi:hypothetical protein
MLELPDVTLLCVDCSFLNESIPIMERCLGLCHFGAVKLLTSEPTDYPYAVKIMPLKDLTVVSVFMLKRVHEFIDTKHFLMIQHDGWILNPDAWDTAWLDYDYIGPVFNQSEMPGVGGFSLRTRRVMARASEISPEWDGTNTDRVQETLGCYEDGILAWGRVGRGGHAVRDGRQPGPQVLQPESVRLPPAPAHRQLPYPVHRARTRHVLGYYVIHDHLHREK